MNSSLKWFQRLTVISIVVNLAFAIPALLIPDVLVGALGEDLVRTSQLWIVDVGMLITTLSVFYWITAGDPVKNSSFAWVMVIGRYFAALTWIIDMMTSSNPMVILQFLIPDLGFGIILGILLQKGLPQEKKLGATIKELFTSTKGFFGSKAVQFIGVSLIILLGWTGYGFWYDLMHAEADPIYTDASEHFKYGVIGLGEGARIPYYIWEVLPTMFPDKLPKGTNGETQGWEVFGLITEPGHATPIGFSKRHIGYPSVEPNCALCHSSTYRKSATDKPTLIPGAPAHVLNLEAFQAFLFACGADERFTPSNVLAEINKKEHLGPFESLLYRFIIIPAVKKGFAEQAAQYAWLKSRPTHGPGRTDTFNPTKIVIFKMPDDHTIGTVDLPATWNQKPRVGLYLHWDGNNNDIHERNFAAAMAVGATSKSVQLASFQLITDYLLSLPAPAFPFPIDTVKSLAGKKIYEENCASCHQFGQPKAGQVTDIATIGTDRHRYDSFTQSLVDTFHSYKDAPFVFNAYNKSKGYSNIPLDGTWARAPYLHNGSVPTLWDLLQKPENRPKTFCRGSNIYDPVKMGYLSSGADIESVCFKYETSLDGNGNYGHDYGTNLTDQEKWELMEYMKTQ